MGGYSHPMKTLLLTLFLLSGCATMTNAEGPKDWPRLTVKIHQVSLIELYRKCGKYHTPVSLLLSGGVIGACAEITFATNRCDIYLSGENSKEIVEHEIDHCFGKDHPGDTTLRDAWDKYKGIK